MRREDGDRALEDAGVDEVDLSPTVLLGRRPDELDTDLELRGLRRGHQERSDVADRYQVVAAPMAYVGERVVLGEERDRGSRRSHTSAEGRLERADAPFDGVPLI